MQVISRKLNEVGDVIRHESLGSGEWMVVEAAMAAAGRSYCNTYPEAWKMTLRRVQPDGGIDWSLGSLIRFQDTAGHPSNLVLPYIEPIRNDRLALGRMHRKELAAYLRWMAVEIEKGSSAQAALNFNLLGSDEYNVNTAVRYVGVMGTEETSFVGQKYIPGPEKPKAVRQKPAAA